MRGQARQTAERADRPDPARGSARMRSSRARCACAKHAVYSAASGPRAPAPISAISRRHPVISALETREIAVRPDRAARSCKARGRSRSEPRAGRATAAVMLGDIGPGKGRIARHRRPSAANAASIRSTHPPPPPRRTGRPARSRAARRRRRRSTSIASCGIEWQSIRIASPNMRVAFVQQGLQRRRDRGASRSSIRASASCRVILPR